MQVDSFYNGSYADAALVGPIAAADISRWVYRTSTSVNIMLQRDDYVPDDNPGDCVWLSARKAEPVRCGIIVDDDFTINYGGGVILYGQLTANYAWQVGDSGGAVFWSSTAKAIQSGYNQFNNAVYSHTHYVQTRTGGWVNVSNCGNYC